MKRYKTFEEFLIEKCFEESPQILDDDRPDFFDAWLSDLTADEILHYAELLIKDNK